MYYISTFKNKILFKKTNIIQTKTKQRYKLKISTLKKLDRY